MPAISVNAANRWPVAVGDGGALGLGEDPDDPAVGSFRGTDHGTGTNERAVEDPAGCRRTPDVADLNLSGTRCPEVQAHRERAVRAGRPRIVTINRAGAATRRRILLHGAPTRPGDDRDEDPTATATATPDTDVAYVVAGRNRGVGSVQGIKPRRWCSGQRFRVVWY